MKIKIAIIGAGRIAYSLTSALLKGGYIVDIIISRKNNSAKALAEKFGVKKYSDNLYFIPKSSNVFLLTVPDSEIKKTAVQLSKLKIDFSTTFFIHFSGAEDTNVLAPLKSKSGKTGSLHLMQTFPSKKIVNIKNVNSAIETNNEAVYKFLLKLCSDLQLIPFRIDSKDKAYYHLAGVYASNFLAGNLFNAQKLLSLSNIDREKYFNILNSTIHSTLQNIKTVGPAKALSGPVDRGDIKTIGKHINSLKKKSKFSKDNYYYSLLKNYIIQSLNLINLVEEKHGVLKKSHQTIRELLIKELENIEKSI